jgi:predicted metal-binding membrane protein
MMLFVACYLVVWALTGIILLLASSISMDTLIRMGYLKQFNIICGILLIISGAYQFSPLKTKCIGYCESPFSFFMRRWKSGKLGAIKMGIFHGLYCLGCCWPYFLLMVFLGWMNLLWMALFSSIIFVEKIWSKGLLVARIAGIGLMILGFVAILFGPITLNLLGVGGIKEENRNSQSMDMKGMMNVANDNTRHISDMHQPYGQHQHNYLV